MNERASAGREDGSNEQTSERERGEEGREGRVGSREGWSGEMMDGWREGRGGKGIPCWPTSPPKCNLVPL